MAIFHITPTTSRLSSTGDAFSPLADDTPGADTLIVDPSAFLIATGAGGDGAVLAATGAWTVTVNGSIVSNQADGISLVTALPDILSTITIGADGGVQGKTAGIFLGRSAYLNNAGTITAESTGGIGIEISLGDIHVITNLGEITAPFGSAIKDTGGTGPDTVKNFGQIDGGINLAGGADRVTNSGLINGAVSLGDGNNILTNSGRISGEVTSDWGTVENSASGVIAGDVQLGKLGNSNTLINSGEIDGFVFGGSHADTIKNFNSIHHTVQLGDGTNNFTNSGFAGGVIGGSDADTVKNSNSIQGSVQLGDGSNILTNSGKISADVIGGSGDDTVKNSSFISGDVQLGDGVFNQFINSGKITGGLGVTGGSGADTVKNSNSIQGSVQLGDGFNQLINSGEIAGSLGVTGGSGADTVINSNFIRGNVQLGDGPNQLINSGEIAGSLGVTGGSGADTVTDFAIVDGLTKSGTIFGDIILGDGNDTFTGGANHETVHDGNGADIVTLGGGNDTYIATGNTGGDGLDIVKGGAGIDTYDASAATTDCQINLDTVAHTHAPFNPSTGLVAANTATGTDISGSAKDTITGFENANGGAGADLIYGTAAANTLSGGNGNDVLFGFGGNDTLVGGAANDILFGGPGKDQLTGGSGTDAFVYAALSDSGITSATRDLVADFQQGVDVIDINFIDANTTNAAGTNDAFNFVGTNIPTGFSGNPGELHAFWSAIGQIVEGDVNGDKKADFSIEIADPTHAITLTSTSFNL